VTNLEKLLAQRKAVSDKIDAILAGDSITAEQQAEHDVYVKEFDALTSRIDMARAAEDRAAKQESDEALAAAKSRKLDANRETADRIAATARKTSSDNTTTREPGVVRTDAENRVTGFLEETDETFDLRIGESRDAQRQQSYRAQKRQNTRTLRSAGYQPWGEFKSCSDFIRAGLNSAGRQSFDERVARHFGPLEGMRDSSGEKFSAVAGMSEGIGSDGGFTIMPELANGIIDRIYQNALWGRTDNYNVTGNSMTFLANAETSRATGSRAGGLRAYYMGEGGSITSSKPTLREVSLKLIKAAAVVYLTNELIADTGVALQEYVTRKVSEEFNFLMGDALIGGTGVGQPLGVLNSPSLISVAKETGQPGSTLQTENIEKIYARFYAPNIKGLYWYHNQDILPQLNLMTLGIGTAGVPTYLPPGGLSAAPYGMLKGRPIEPVEFCSTIGTQGDLIAADLGQMLSINKGGVAQAVSMHVQFLTDQLALRFIIRFNAGPWENSPITPYKGTNTQSSFVTLDSRS
jgi:HK97 family phage major capsid protein